MAGQRVKLWDLPVRVTHWSLVVLMPALWWTWKSDQMAVHVRLGYVALALMIFRVFWGLFGAETARFASFVKGPRAVFASLRGLLSKGGAPSIGHNPMGGWSVVILIALIVTDVGLGLFAEDTDGLNSGPLNYLVQGDLSERLTHWHGQVFNLLLVFIALHLVAIAFYALVKRENLVGPMVTGRRTLAEPAATPAFAPVWRIALGVVIALAGIWWISLGAPIPGLGKH